MHTLFASTLQERSDPLVLQNMKITPGSTNQHQQYVLDVKWFKTDLLVISDGYMSIFDELFNFSFAEGPPKRSHGCSEIAELEECMLFCRTLFDCNQPT